MIESMDGFLAYFRGVHQRTVRDVCHLPAEAGRWKPPSPAGGNAWSIGTIVGHIATSRTFFVQAYCEQVWRLPDLLDLPATEMFLPALEESLQLLEERLRASPEDWLARQVPMLGQEGSLSGWRVLMLLAEHEVHHRSQIVTYASLNGWPVADIFGRSWEQAWDFTRRCEVGG